jgi:hypothetical protein
MRKIVFVLLTMMLIAVPCLAFDGYQGHPGQIPLCQNNKTGALKFAPSKDIDKTPGLNYEPRCNEKTETLIWVNLGPPSGLHAIIEPMTDVSEADLAGQGWTECYSDLYNNSGTALSTIFSQCNKKYLMLACRPVGSATFTLASYANRNQILTDTGAPAANKDVTHISNGTGWYYNTNSGYGGWGFAEQGDPVYKNQCDTSSSPNPEMRLCWHTYNGTLSYGFRCGADAWLNSSTDWQRVILHHD